MPVSLDEAEAVSMPVDNQRLTGTPSAFFVDKFASRSAFMCLAMRSTVSCQLDALPLVAGWLRALPGISVGSGCAQSPAGRHLGAQRATADRDPIAFGCGMNFLFGVSGAVAPGCTSASHSPPSNRVQVLPAQPLAQLSLYWRTSWLVVAGAMPMTARLVAHAGGGNLKTAVG